MNVVSLELSKKLYDLTGWEETDCFYADGDAGDADDKLEEPEAVTIDHADWARQEYGNGLYESKICPAYDLGYLMRKLPRDIRIKRDHRYEEEMWVATSMNCEVNDYTPEGAACRACIALFERGVLKK